MLEFHRAALTEGVFGFAGKQSFERDDFELDAHGIVRLENQVAREIAALALKIVPAKEAVKSVKRVVRWL